MTDPGDRATRVRDIDPETGRPETHPNPVPEDGSQGAQDKVRQDIARDNGKKISEHPDPTAL